MLYDPNDFCKDPLQIDFGDLRTEASSNSELWRLDSVLSCEEITKESLFDLVLTHCEECLYIIGNGFDLHHGLKTRYLDFRGFLKQDKTDNQHRALLKLLSRNFELPEDDGEKEWNLFEENIKYANSMPFIKGTPLNKNTIEESCDNLAKEIGTINDSLDPAFYAWIKSLEDEMKSFKTLNHMEIPLLGDKALYLSYNYTDVLERFYETAPKNVFHIHGVYSESQIEPLYLGFGDLSFKVLDSYHKLLTYAEIDENAGPDFDIDNKPPRLNTLSEDGKKALLSFFMARNKTYYLENYRCYDFNTKIINQLQKIRKVIVLGHSFGASDAFSLRLLRDKLQDRHVKWYLGLWLESEPQYRQNYIRMVMYKMFLTKEQTRYFLW